MVKCNVIQDIMHNFNECVLCSYSDRLETLSLLNLQVNKHVTL